VQGDRVLVAAELRPIRGDAPMTDAEIETFVSRLSGVTNFAREQAGRRPRSLRARLQARARDDGRVSSARRRLIEAGAAGELIQKLPCAQIILLDEKRDYEIRRDERNKLLALPVWEIDSLPGGEDPAADEDGLFGDLLPTIVKLRRTQARLDQQVAVLRHVEALRLYAAADNGKLPARLTDIPVPLPVDPFTGKPFGYELDGTTAHLRGGSLRGQEREPGGSVHYEVTLQK
jgi:hypothetical protein